MRCEFVCTFVSSAKVPSLQLATMANELEIFDFIEADAAEERSARKRHRQRQINDPFNNLNEEEFIKRYRLTKDVTYKLCDELRPLFKIPQRPTDLSVETKVLIALSFYATGSYQQLIGNNEGHFVAQQTVSSAISQVTACLNSSEMRQKHIKFPSTQHERNKIKTEFYNKFHIPGVIGCIDCSQIAIVRPVHFEERYYCRKHYHSLNVQFICDANMQIMSVDASHGGATHDSFIWASHRLNNHIANLSNTENIWFLGDSGYPLRRFTMTPILNAPPDTPEANFTKLHVHARNIVERTIGLLKARFRCLLVHRVLHYSPAAAGSIVNACVILHNICNEAQTPVEELSDQDIAQEAQLQENSPPEPSHSRNLALQQGIATRNALVQQLWERRHLIS